MTTNPDNKGDSLRYECTICWTVYDESFTPSCTTVECDDHICQGCLRNYLENVVKDPGGYKSFDCIRCPHFPDCEGQFITQDIVKQVYSQSEAEKWWESALHSRVYIRNKVQCPMDDCKAVFDVDDECIKQCTFAECIQCHTGICAVCQTPWHPGVRKVTKDKDALMKSLQQAKESGWCRCSACREMVELLEGCEVIYCRCGMVFCYYCGQEAGGEYGAGESCGCNSWSDEQLNEHRKAMFNYNDNDA